MSVTTPRLFSAQMLARKLISPGQQLVARAVAGEEGDLAAVQRAAHHGRGGRTKGCHELLGVGRLQRAHRIQTCPADDADHGCRAPFGAYLRARPAKRQDA